MFMIESFLKTSTPTLQMLSVKFPKFSEEMLQRTQRDSYYNFLSEVTMQSIFNLCYDS